MADNENAPGGETPQDDMYVIEDTGESLNDFDYTDAAGPKAASTAAESSDLEPELEKLREENRKLKDQYLRKMADFENFRKRSEREKSDYFKWALADVMREVVPVLDNFERALAMASDGDGEFRKGVELIYKQLLEVLQKYGLKPVDTALVTFDPTVHEAVMRDDDSDLAPNTVVEVLQKGYFLNERLLRPAMVKVAVGKSS